MNNLPCNNCHPVDDDIQDFSDLPPDVVMNIPHNVPTRTMWSAFDGQPPLRDILLDIRARIERIERILFSFEQTESK